MNWGRQLAASAPGRFRRYWVIIGAAHLLLSWVACLVLTLGSFQRTFAAVGFLAAQSFLISTWASTSGRSIWQRAAGGLTGPLYLAGLIAFATFEIEITGLILMVAIFTGIVFQSLRRIGRGIRKIDAVDAPSRRINFSIWQLLILTSLAAVFLGLRRIDLPNYGVGDVWRLVAAVALILVANGLATTWAVLGDEHFPARCALACCSAVGAGLVTTVALDAGLDREGITCWTICCVVQSVAIAGTLYFARRRGFRLVKLGPAGSDATTAAL